MFIHGGVGNERDLLLMVGKPPRNCLVRKISSISKSTNYLILCAGVVW